jgi:Ca2+-binding RTX toxin-like protein
VGFGTGSTFAAAVVPQAGAPQASRLAVQGAVTLKSPRLSVNAPFVNAFTPVGTTFTVIDNDGTDPVGGAFASLPEGATFQVTAVTVVNGTTVTQTQSYRISYVGGSGNDVTLTFLGSGLVFRGTDGDDVIHIGWDFLPVPGFEDCTREQAAADLCPHRDVVLFTLNGVTTPVEYTGGHTVTVLAGKGDDLVDAAPIAGAHWRMEFFGGQGDDHLAGGALGDLLDGGVGHDLLEGLGGDDELRGGPGNDVLDGGPGSDLLDGGPGRDVLLHVESGDRVVTGPGRSDVVGSAALDRAFAAGAGADPAPADLVAALLKRDRNGRLSNV